MRAGLAPLPSVSVLVVTRNRCKDVLETLDAVAGLDYPAERLEVLVLDNGSDDGTAAAVDAWAGGVEGRRLARVACLRSADNLGPAAARNVLAATAAPAGDLYVLLDDDAVPEPAFLLKALLAFGGEPAVGIVGARIVAFDRPERDLGGAGRIDWRLGRFRDVPVGGTTDCDFVLTCAMVVRREAFQAAGGFDEDYFVYHEDVDFCVRARRHGFGVRYEPSAVARHKVPPGKRRAPERLYYLVRNKYLFLRKHVPLHRHPLAWLAYAPALMPVMLLQSLAVHRAIAPREWRAILAGWWDGLRGRTGRWRG